MALNELHL